MIDLSALDAVASERVSKSAKPPEERFKHVTFSVAEFDELRRQIGKPAWIGADFKALLQAIGSGKVVLALAKPKA